MRKRSWVWVGVGEAVATILAAALAYLINVLTAEQHVRISVVVGVVALVVFSALFAWGRRAVEAKRSTAEKGSADGSPSHLSAPGVTLSGQVKDSPVVFSGG